MDSSFRTRKAHGFTLVELLVVIAIIGILIALLLPAVQAARSAARRTECVNKLKQLALGLHNYHDTFHNFPAGEITPGNCCGTQSFENWAISILPFIEQGNLYEQYNFNQRNEHSSNRVVRESNIDTHNCPSDINAGKLERPESGPGRRLLYRMSSYRAVGGATSGGGWWDNRQYRGAGGLQRAGVLHWVWDLRGRELAPEKMATVTDGTAYTLMLGEMATKTRPRRGTFWAYSYTSYNSSDVTYVR
ncbi:MAG: DUF1559 domain-containing protein [Planctomycetes bacterium]|nr:DUF1559 domain-containing protein [Planctomycetota bacterium]